LGNEWSIPIHLGILAAFANDNLEYKYFADFKNWQENSSYLKQIGPRFGLSRDYDLFILAMSGGIFALISILFYKVPESREYIAKEIYTILIKSDRFDVNFTLFNAIWLLHISPDSERSKYFYKYAMDLINNNGGIPESLFKNPLTNFIGFLEGDVLIEEYGENVQVPGWEIFRTMKSSLQLNPDIVFGLAINYLTEEEEYWKPITAGQL
jgi:hypothetical protein